jgi:valyl-tRNA synthetase
MPFITEHLYLALSSEAQKSIMISKFPENLPLFEDVENEFELIKEAVISIRRAKTSAGAANKRTELAFIMPNNKEAIKAENIKFISQLSKCEKVELVEVKPDSSAVDVSANLQTFAPMGEEEKNALKTKLEAQITKLQKELDKLNGMLKNEKFVANAPKELIETNQSAANEIETRIKAMSEERLALA